MGDINFPLLETTRPPMYKFDKYWGKKPVNIWSEYIKNYTNEGDVVLDMFGGSGVCAIESLILKRRVITNDLNPMHAFRLKTFLYKFDKNEFLDIYNKLYQKFISKVNGLDFFKTECPNCKSESMIINTLWSGGGSILNQIGYECNTCLPRGSRFRNTNWFQKNPDNKDIKKFNNLNNLSFESWIPDQKLPTSTDAFTSSFLRDLGGNTYSNLWSKQNLYVLSYMFSEIKKIENQIYRHLFYHCFLKCLRTTFGKMNTPRTPERGNRDWSTSWGRSGFLFLNKQIHMNPLVQFKRSVEDKQGILKSLDSANERFTNLNITYTEDVDDFFKNNKDLLILTHDSTNLDQVLPENSVDFILTDPPYGNTIKYFALDSVHTSWLENIDTKYKMDFDSELIIKNDNYQEYEQKFIRCFKSAHKILKKDKKTIITFHSKDLKLWSLLQKSLEYAGFDKEKIILQPNLRSGETVTANPYSQTSNDFYLRYKNTLEESSTISDLPLDRFRLIILTEAKEILAQAGEPIEKARLEPGIMRRLFNLGYSLATNPDEIDLVLFNEIDETFHVEGKKTKPESIWSLKNFEYRHIPLSERTETVVRDLILRENIVSFNQIYEAVFTTFSDNLTPPYRSLRNIISKYAEEITSGNNKGKWKLKIQTQQNTSIHDMNIGKLAEIGKKLDYEIWIGNVEQGHNYKNGKLSDLMTSNILNLTDYEANEIHTIKQIDLIWYKNRKIKSIFEIENSTSILSALNRGSYINDNDVKRYIVLPESGSQRDLFARLQTSPFFQREYQSRNWQVRFYSDVDRDHAGVINNNKQSSFQ